MPIAHISESTARAITSAQALHDAISVVKELIDNALDSRADNITIEISQNTLDIIQIKDNGSGICEEDRKLLCQSGYTSKIRSIDDLAGLGGTFLGFRGEALASIARLSSAVTITTRVDGDMVAAAVSFDSNGILISSSPASHGTGTTVRVTDFLKKVPVRQQTALKNAVKILLNVRRLLSEYAFARPTVRLQLRVLRAAKEKSNWSYTPSKTEDELVTTAQKIVGSDVTSQCQTQTVLSDDGAYRIDALLANAEADFTKLGGVGQFVSVDGRPITADRGFMKELIQIYRSYLQNTTNKGASIPQKPFVYIRLQCPKGSYDVNIEPSKDEVLFENQARVLTVFDDLCRKTYGERYVMGASSQSKKNDTPRSYQNFDVLLASKPSDAHNTAANSANVDPLALVKVTTRAFMENAARAQNKVTEESDPPEHEASILDKGTLEPSKSSTLNVRSSLLGRKDSDDTTEYQNPGPPNRPWKSRRVMDDNDSHQRVSTTAQTSQQTSLIDSWAQALASPKHADRIQTSEGDSASSDTTDRTPAASGDQYTGSHAAQARRGPAHSLPGQPFRTPFKTSSGNVVVTTPEYQRNVHLEHGALPTPSPTPRVQGPQFPGFHRPSRSDAQLQEIMDFENRKRDTMIIHKRSIKHQNPGDDKSVQGTESTSKEQKQHVIGSAQASRTPIDEYAKRFEGTDPEDDIPPQPSSASYTEYAHWNLHRKAAPGSESLQANKSQDIQSNSLESRENRMQERRPLGLLALSSEDPRAYLIKLQNDVEDGSNTLDTNKKTSGRPKLSRLPFESIDPQSATYGISIAVACVGSLNIQKLTDAVSSLQSADAYIKSGPSSLLLDLRSTAGTHDITRLETNIKYCLQRFLLSVYKSDANSIANAVESVVVTSQPGENIG